MSEKALYYDGISPAPFGCDLSVDENNLNIFVKDPSVGLVVWKFDRISCQNNFGHLTVKYGNDQEKRVECSGDIAKRIYERWTGRTPAERVKRSGFSVIAALMIFGLVLAGLGLLAYLVVLPWVGEKAAAIIPRDVEVSIGQTLSQQFTSGETSGRKADSLINAFGKRIDFGTQFPIQLYVLKSDEINAFAVPGGNIFVYSGIIRRMSTYEELVALLGHEASHVEKRHSLKSVCRSAASGFLIAALFGDVSGVAAGILSQADEFRELQYSRELETEADLEGLRVMRRNNIDESGMVRLLELLDKEAVRTPRLMKYVSTHPETQERLTSVKAHLEAQDPRQDEELRELFDRIKNEIGR